MTDTHSDWRMFADILLSFNYKDITTLNSIKDFNNYSVMETDGINDLILISTLLMFML